MRIVFLGSPAFAIPTLRALIDSEHEIVAVVTQPDRPAGRGHAATPPPVKTLALEYGFTVMQPERVSDTDSVERLRGLDPDVLIIAAYGQILRQRLLEVPKRGALNVHASLLPRHRGASPIAAAIVAGDDVTGVTIMEVVRALDAGPILASVPEPILPSDTSGTLEARLAAAGARLLAETLDPWAKGRLQATPQDDSLATYAPLIKREDAQIDWRRPAVAIWRHVRGFNPWPVAFTHWHGEELRIFEAWPLPGDTGADPATVLATPPDEAKAARSTLSVQTGAGRLALLKLQRPGRKILSGDEFLRGQRGILGAKLGGEA